MTTKKIGIYEELSAGSVVPTEGTVYGYNVERSSCRGRLSEQSGLPGEWDIDADDHYRPAARAYGGS